MSSPRSGRSAQPHGPLLVERYAVYDRFESGGMATVHFARVLGAQGFRRTVAAKRLLPHLLADQAFVELLAEEARLSARVRHPNVVATLDVVQTASELLLVMEYVHGESLAKLARSASRLGEPIPLPIASAIISDALHGLHAAHEAQDERGQPLELVHRDVSPQNVLVGTDGITRIADFGIAKAAGRSPVTRDGVLKGKLGYMAPEQLNVSAITRSVDIFASAAVLWELLTGEQLFGGHTHAEVAFKVAAAPIPPPSTRNAALPAELDAIVLRGLARDPAARYASAREMALALEANTPSARPSEIAAFVERVAAESLTRRAAVLRSIERLDGGQGELRPREVHASGESGTSTAISERSFIQPDEGELAGERLSTSSPGELVASAQAAAGGRPAPTKTSLYTRLGLAIALTIVALLGMSAARERRQASSAPPRGRVAAPASTQARSPEVAVTPPQRAIAHTSAVDAAIEPASPANSVAPPVPPRTRAAPRTKVGCDPPYSIDGTGKVLFKIECM